MTLGGDHDPPSSEDLGKCLRILVLRRSKFAHVNERRVFRIKYRKVEAGVVVEILYLASQRPERPHGLTLDVVHGNSTHALPRLFGIALTRCSLGHHAFERNRRGSENSVGETPGQRRERSWVGTRPMHRAKSTTHHVLFV
jgi:hypothetical protein